MTDKIDQDTGQENDHRARDHESGDESSDLGIVDIQNLRQLNLQCTDERGNNTEPKNTHQCNRLKHLKTPKSSPGYETNPLRCPVTGGHRLLSVSL
jgi:hypothetical protein